MLTAGSDGRGFPGSCVDPELGWYTVMWSGSVILFFFRRLAMSDS
jgi:hypothetical protein